MADIFISYAREDRSRIEPLARALAERGWSVWWDRRFRPGEDIDRRISEELAAARCIIVAWSNSALKSPWVRDEAAEGRDRNVLASVLLEQVMPPLGFRAFHAADLSGWRGQRDDELEKLLIDIGEISWSSRRAEQRRLG